MVGGAEDGVVVAPRGRERRGARGLTCPVTCSDPREGDAEALDGARRRPAPPVDRLVRVAHGGDRVPVPEERGEQRHLRHGRVLVLIEQDHPILRPLAGRDLRHLTGDAARQRHLIPEVQDAEVTLAAGELRHEVNQGGPGPQARDRLGDVGPGQPRVPTAGRRVLLAQGLGQGEHLRGGVRRFQEVLGERAGEFEHRLGHRARSGLDGEVSRPRLDDPFGELPAPGLGEESGLGVPPHPEGVVAKERSGVGVVGGDARPVVADALGRRAQRAAQPAQAQADPFREFAGRLAGEGEAEHLLGTDQPVRHEPDHARGHRLGLARPRPRHHEHGLQRRLDHRDLLGRRFGQPQEAGDLRGRDRAAHRATRSPSGTAGQDVRTGHVRHASPGVATKVPPPTALATWVIISSAHASVSGAWWRWAASLLIPR